MKTAGVLCAIGVGCVLGRDANAQLTAEQRPPLDSITQGYHDAMIVVRDELVHLRSVSDRASRNAAAAAPETLASQVVRLREACEAASRTATEQAARFDPATAAPRLRAQVADVSEALAALTGNLRGGCVEIFNERFVSMSDSVRQWTPYYVRQLQRHMQQYHNASNALAHAADFRLEPQFEQ